MPAAPSIQERLFAIDEPRGSAETSLLIREFLQAQVGLLVENDAMGRYVKDGKEHFRVSGDHTGAEIGSDEYYETRAKQEEEGHVGSVDISRDVKSGRIVFAKVGLKLPATLTEEEAGSLGSLFRADSITSRFQFPSPHSRTEDPRVVFDTWRTPVTQIAPRVAAMNSFAHSDARVQAYSTLFRNMFNRTDDSGIPLGAIDISHTVIGRPNQNLSSGERASIATAISGIEQGVQVGIAHDRQIAAEVAAELID